jgi:hypothetical protein
MKFFRFYCDFITRNGPNFKLRLPYFLKKNIFVASDSIVRRSVTLNVNAN